MKDIKNYCNLCPRKCNIDRNINKGFCTCDNTLSIAYYGKFMYEEPCISGDKGSGAIFFTGCNLKCVYCQNYQISRKQCGKNISEEEFIDIVKQLEKQDVHNINLVTPTHYSNQIYNALKQYNPSIPVVYNTNSYETVENIEKMAEVVDIFLADLKYFDWSIAKRYSNVEDYFSVATKAIDKMIKLKQNIIEDDIMKQGVIVRVLILPNNIDDTLNILKYIKDKYPNVIVSVMSQYIPCENLQVYPEINRKINEEEYEKVLAFIMNNDFDGYFQDRESASTDYIPKWMI